MFDYSLFIAVLLIPFFISGIKTYRKGLVTGLFISLLYWGKITPALSLISLGSVLCIFFSGRKNQQKEEVIPYVKNPGLPMLWVFIISMTIFCAFENSFALYGNYLGISSEILQFSGSLDIFAFLAGPVILGSWCDRKGPFGAAIFLTLLSEISVWCAANAEVGTTLFVLGCFFVHFCSAGFFVVLPVLVYTFFGKVHFARLYPAVALVTAVVWIGARLLYLHLWSASYNPGSFLISLSLLTILSAFFLVVAWKKRFTLVAEKLQKTS